MTILRGEHFSWFQQVLRAKTSPDGCAVSAGSWPAFELADAMELGLSKELTSQYAEPPSEQRTRELTVTRTEEEHVLLCENQQPLLVARPGSVPMAGSEAALCIDIFLPCDGSIPMNLGPAFRLTHSEDKKRWELSSLRCEYHEFQPSAVSRCCSRAYSGQRVLFRVEQESCAVGRGRLMKMQVEVPKHGDVWCNCNSHGLKPEETIGIILPSRMPKWNKRTKSLTMSFNKRCTKASIRNCQLSASEAAPDDVAVQFGKMATGDFGLDFKEPFGPVQAFALALTTAHWK